MLYDEVRTEKELMLFLDENIKYGFINQNNEVLLDSSDDNFQKICMEQWRLRDVFEIIKSGVGHCYDQVEIERDWFSKHNFEFKTIWISAYQKDIENSGFSHSYLIYFDKQKWNLFEHSDFTNKGFFSFKTFEEAVKFQAMKQIQYAENQMKPKVKYDTFITEFDKPKTGLTMYQYHKFVLKSKAIKI